MKPHALLLLPLLSTPAFCDWSPNFVATNVYTATGCGTDQGKEILVFNGQDGHTYGIGSDDRKFNDAMESAKYSYRTGHALAVFTNESQIFPFSYLLGSGECKSTRAFSKILGISEKP